MNLRPILSSLTRHKLTVLLLVLQVALTCGIVCNVAFMIADRVTQMNQASGVAEDELVMIDSIDVDARTNPLARHTEDLAALRGIAGMRSVVAVDALPFNANDWTSSLDTQPDSDINQAIASVYNGTPGELRTLGLHLVEGRDFLPGEYLPVDSANNGAGLGQVSTAIVTRALADKLFPGRSALGRSIYPFSRPARIVGIVDHLLRPGPHETGSNDYSALFPLLPDTAEVTYVMRTSPQDRERVLQAAATLLAKVDGNRIIRRPQTFEQMRADHFHRDRTMVGMLLAAAAALAFVTAVAIAGLAHFWVQQRRRTIGIRRAIGATRGDILHYFQLENFLIVSGGIVLGLLLAMLLNLLLMKHYELPRLPLFYLPIGAVVLWTLGQLAVLGPALRASNVPPVVATRSV
ncbi:MAG: FtsX-like permease family protein [Rhodanobacter sp.]